VEQPAAVNSQRQAAAASSQYQPALQTKGSAGYQYQQATFSPKHIHWVKMFQ